MTAEGRIIGWIDCNSQIMTAAALWAYPDLMTLTDDEADDLIGRFVTDLMDEGLRIMLERMDQAKEADE